MQPPSLILASSSKYRLHLLNQIGLFPICITPNINETVKPFETAEALAIRLSIEKAEAVAQLQPNAIIIAGDQVCDIKGAILGKPGNVSTAKEQLTLCSGREVIFHTGLCVYNPMSNQLQSYSEQVHVRFRDLSSNEIDRYIAREPALDCAGSFKMEGLGISLFKYIRSNDPNTLIGLPIIKLCELLRNEGIFVL
ncbi:Maf-like protein YceF [Zhongshania aliphaticivorans]|uniref:7-methyl-GTP pyrophosphatase n=1 Tax=Zhongshania aliphaticivorans TaxID=1470434 RepID=A0A5S9NGY4_9GAMM|nr:Maf family protein [Zhongshania aliphaticivorans]CAA0089400.1 Maf-like protein YceF [Zhongshania aliphaticivorans]CAA0096165.1 Maf-like protein YceF [Zhongshania aliphaticivorans]